MGCLPVSVQRMTPMPRFRRRGRRGWVVICVREPVLASPGAATPRGTAPATRRSHGEDAGERLAERGRGIGRSGGGPPGDELVRSHQDGALLPDAPDGEPRAVGVPIAVLRADGGDRDLDAELVL